MDIQQITTILKDLGLPAAVSAVLTVLVKALFDARQRRSKESLLDWLTQASATEPFKGDDRELRALHELQQSLVFERAFGLKAESSLRNELLLFAESQHESMRFQEVLDAGRFISRLSPARSSSPKQVKAFKVWSQMSKLAGYCGLVLGYILFFGYAYLLNTRGLQYWRSAAGGLVFGALMMLSGSYNFKKTPAASKLLQPLLAGASKTSAVRFKRNPSTFLAKTVMVPNSDVLPFGRLWYGEPNATSNAIDYAKFYSHSHNAGFAFKMMRANVIETHEHGSDFKGC